VCELRTRRRFLLAILFVCILLLLKLRRSLRVCVKEFVLLLLVGTNGIICVISSNASSLRLKYVNALHICVLCVCVCVCVCVCMCVLCVYLCGYKQQPLHTRKCVSE